MDSIMPSKPAARRVDAPPAGWGTIGSRGQRDGEAMTRPVPDGELRVSDSERDATLQLLSGQAAEGRLTLDELEERAGQALSAKTRADLATVTRDLPADPAPAGQAASRKPPVRWFVAIMGGSRRRGRFRAASQLNSLAIMGGDEIDLRDAEIGSGGLTLNLYSVMGGSIIYLPDTVDVEISGFAIMGGNEERGPSTRPRPGAPTVRIKAFSLMGGSTIWRLPPQARGLPLPESRRLAQPAEQGQLPPSPGHSPHPLRGGLGVDRGRTPGGHVSRRGRWPPHR